MNALRLRSTACVAGLLGWTALSAAGATLRFATTTLARPAQEGVTWLQLVGTREDLSAVRFVNGWYVALGEKGSVLFSRDARTWELRYTMPGRPADEVVGGDGRFLLYRTETTIQAQPMFYSADGMTWVQRTDPTRTTMAGYAAGRFWRPGGRWVDDRMAWGLASSADGSTWQEHHTLPPELDSVKATLRIGGVQELRAGLLFRVDYDRVESTGDLVKWYPEFTLPPAPAGEAPEKLRYLAGGNGHLVVGAIARDGPGRVHVLTPGESWRRIEAPWTYLHVLEFAGGMFLAHESDDGLYISPDGLRWKTVAHLPGVWSRFAHGPAGYVFVGREGVMAIVQPTPAWRDFAAMPMPAFLKP